MPVTPFVNYSVVLRATAFFTVLIGVVGLVTATAKESHADVVADYQQLSKAAHLIVDEQGSIVASSHADTPLIPASTVKLVTAWLSLEHWGEDYRFTTAFYYNTGNQTLAVKAGGDPFLVSEEIALIADNLAAAGVDRVSVIRLQTDLFQPDLIVPGATTTDNPYDAVPTALAANFNTVNVQVDATGVTSAESQTPLTPTAKKIAMDLNKSGKFRVNIGRSSKLAGQYFAELLAAMLKDRGVEVNDVVEWGAAPDAAPVYVHRNSKTLGEIIEGMLKYSTNFIANQLMLTMVAELTDRPASFDQVERYLDDRLSRNPGWSGFKLLEGAGLSPENRLTAMHLVQLLEKFRRWQHLLPEVHSGIIAKTGTLTGVKTLAGFAEDARGRQLPFAVLINQQVDASMPVQLIDALVNRN